MQETETIAINDTMRHLRALQKDLREWQRDNPYADARYVAMVVTKLEEAELLASRMVKHESEYGA